MKNNITDRIDKWLFEGMGLFILFMVGAVILLTFMAILTHNGSPNPFFDLSCEDQKTYLELSTKVSNTYVLHHIKNC